MKERGSCAKGKGGKALTVLVGVPAGCAEKITGLSVGAGTREEGVWKKGNGKDPEAWSGQFQSVTIEDELTGSVWQRGKNVKGGRGAGVEWWGCGGGKLAGLTRWRGDSGRAGAEEKGAEVAA